MFFSWRPYVPVAQKRANAERHLNAMKKKGMVVQPITIAGRTIARSFWGASWCAHLEQFSDYENRLPRGRTYVRNGSVCHLEIKNCEVHAIVSGSDLYHIKITIEPLGSGKWAALKRQCAGQIGSLLDLLQGKLSDGVMAVVTDKDDGLFPHPKQIKMKCDCPDSARMCKHLAAVLYGVGSRLDHAPELLFLLRGVDHGELIATKADALTAVAAKAGKGRRLKGADLSDVFGVDIAQEAPEQPAAPPARTAKRGKAAVPPTPPVRPPRKAAPAPPAVPAAPQRTSKIPAPKAPRVPRRTKRNSIK